ncbi:head fiber protein, partial [Pontibacter silvestris]
NTVPVGAINASGTAGSTTFLRGDGTWATVSGGATNLGYTSAASTGIVTSSTGTSATLPAATTTAAGLFTAADKTKLDGIAASANNYTLPAATATTLGGVKVGSGLAIDASGVLSATATGTGTTVSDATTTAKGIVQLAGDLSGTAAAPTIAANAVTSAKI